MWRTLKRKLLEQVSVDGLRLIESSRWDEKGDGENGERQVDSRDAQEIKIHKI